MRPSLLDGLLGVLRRNRGQGRSGMAVMETGRIHRPVEDAIGAPLDALIGTGWRWSGPDGFALPLQPRTVGFAAFGVRGGPGWLDEAATWDVEDVLAAMDELVRRAGGAPLVRRSVDRPGWHPGRTVVLELDGQEVGIAGQLHPRMSEAWDLPDPVVAGELLLEVLLAAEDAGTHRASAPALVRHPAVVVDVAVVAAETLTIAALERALRDAVGPVLDDLRWFDEFRGSQLPDGHRSVAFRLRLQDAERQLADEDADSALQRVAAALAGLGASLRA